MFTQEINSHLLQDLTYQISQYKITFGEMTERFKVAVLKTVVPKGPWVRIPVSPHTDYFNMPYIKKRRGAREAEGNSLLNCRRVISSTAGSNPALSEFFKKTTIEFHRRRLLISEFTRQNPCFYFLPLFGLFLDSAPSPAKNDLHSFYLSCVMHGFSLLLIIAGVFIELLLADYFPVPGRFIRIILLLTAVHLIIIMFFNVLFFNKACKKYFIFRPPKSLIRLLQSII